MPPISVAPAAGRGPVARRASSGGGRGDERLAPGAQARGALRPQVPCPRSAPAASPTAGSGSPPLGPRRAGRPARGQVGQGQGGRRHRIVRGERTRRHAVQRGRQPVGRREPSAGAGAHPGRRSRYGRAESAPALPAGRKPPERLSSRCRARTRAKPSVSTRAASLRGGPGMPRPAAVRHTWLLAHARTPRTEAPGLGEPGAGRWRNTRRTRSCNASLMRRIPPSADRPRTGISGRDHR